MHAAWQPACRAAALRRSQGTRPTAGVSIYLAGPGALTGRQNATTISSARLVCQSANRFESYDPDSRGDYLGFR